MVNEAGATGTLGQAKSAYQGVTFGALSGKHWPATLPSGYATRMTAIKKTQLTAGWGASGGGVGSDLAP